jgi:hypothetical protein
MKRDGTSMVNRFIGSSGSRPSAPNPAQSSALATTFSKSVKSAMTWLLGLHDSGVYVTEAAVRWYSRPACLNGDACLSRREFLSARQRAGKAAWRGSSGVVTAYLIAWPEIIFGT